MKCANCGYYNICPSCSDWLCDNCGAELLNPERIVEREQNSEEKSCYIQQDWED